MPRAGPVAAIVALALTALLRGQCATQWQPGLGPPGTDGDITAATMWDPDGPGPVAGRLVIGGYFSVVGTTLATGIATYDLQSGTWNALGGGLPFVECLLALPNGDLIAGGGFTTPGAVADRVARWNGSAWVPMGTGIDGWVNALALDGNGHVIVGGNFASAGGVATASIARWDGANWHALGAGVQGATYALATRTNGDVIAAGYFTMAGGAAAMSIASWNGTTWAPLGAGISGSPGIVYALLPLPNGDVVAAGDFTVAGTVAAASIARWDGASWNTLGAGIPYGARALTRLPTGDIVAGGYFGALLRWNGTAWSTMSAAQGFPVAALALLPNGEVVAGGRQSTSDWSVVNLVRWNGTAWAPMEPGMTGAVAAMVHLANGDLVVGGSLSHAGAVDVPHLARHSGGTWSPFAPGLAYNQYVAGLAVLPNQDVVAVGNFTTIGSTITNGIARWDGTTWQALGTGLTSTNPATTRVDCVLAPASGELFIGGRFDSAGGGAASNIARWNGTTWSTLGSGVQGSPPIFPSSLVWIGVHCLLELANGDLVAGGWFHTAGGVPTANIARWDGTAWHALGSGVAGVVDALAQLANGDLVAGGNFSLPSGTASVARWDGNSWQGFTGGLLGAVHAVHALPDGDFLIGGQFSIPSLPAAYGVARWRGQSWISPGTTFGIHRAMGTFAAAPDGSVLAGGAFLGAGGVVCTSIARLASSCPATAQPVGTACIGSSGTATLETTAMPWLGSICRARATGLPATGFALVAYGVGTAAVPLASILPQGVAGCALLTTLDDVALMPLASTLTTARAIPSNPALVGFVFHHQVGALATNAIGSFVEFTATNRLTLTIGVF